MNVPTDTLGDWWFPPTNTKAADAVGLLRRKYRFGRWVELYNKPGNVLGWRLVPLAVITACALTALSRPVAVGFGVLLACYFLSGSIAKWSNRRNTRNLRGSIRRGAYGFDVMWQFDAEWASFTNALPAGLTPHEILGSDDSAVIQIIANYLKSTFSQRRIIRTAEAPLAVNHPARISLNEAAHVAAQAIYRHHNG